MTRFYFVHSYYVHAEDRSLLAAVLSTVSVPMQPWPGTIFSPCSFTRRRVQARVCNLLRNFLEWNGTC